MGKDDRERSPIPAPPPSGISDIDPRPGGVFSRVRNADDFEVDPDPTPISPENSTDQMLLKIGVMVERQSASVAQIPALAREVTTVATRQEEMEKSLNDAKERLHGIESSDHYCKNQATINRHEEESKEWRQDKEAGIKSREMITNVAAAVNKVDKDIKDVQSSGRKLLGSMVTAALGIIIVVVGGAWNTGGRIEGVNQRLEAEKQIRAEQHTTLKARLDRVPTAEQQVENISQVMIENGHSFDARCKRLSDGERRYLARQVQQGKLPPSFLCL